MRGFSLIELIFVLVIIGVLSIIAISYVPKNLKLVSDTQMLRWLILQKRADALGFKVLDDSEKDLVCLDFNDVNLSDYKFDSKIYVFYNDKEINKICYDDKGRLHIDDIKNDLSTLAKGVVEINLSRNDKNKTLKIYPFSGVVY